MTSLLPLVEAMVHRAQNTPHFSDRKDPGKEMHSGCSDLHPDGKIRVCIEREKNLFDVDTDHATCWLPEYRWEDIQGFSSVAIAKTEQFIKSVIDQINESATAQSEEQPT